MTQSTISMSGIEVMKLMAADKHKSHILVKDDVCMGGLIMVLSNDDNSVVCSALETLLRLAEWPDLRTCMKNFLGMQDQLDALMAAASPSIMEIAKKIHDLLYTAPPEPMLHQAPLKDSNNLQRMHNSKRESNQRSARRNSFFVSGVNKAKTITLQIRGLTDKDDLELCRTSLLTVKGVISITFDFKKKRAILRTKPDIRTELLAQAIARTMTMSAEQVIKNDDGTESLVLFGADGLLADKENAEMPDYPSEEDSPVSGHMNVARLGGEQPADANNSWRFIKTVGSFLSNSLYW